MKHHRTFELAIKTLRLDITLALSVLAFSCMAASDWEDVKWWTDPTEKALTTDKLIAIVRDSEFIATGKLEFRMMKKPGIWYSIVVEVTSVIKGSRDSIPKNIRFIASRPWLTMGIRVGDSNAEYILFFDKATITENGNPYESIVLNHVPIICTEENRHSCIQAVGSQDREAHSQDEQR